MRFDACLRCLPCFVATLAVLGSSGAVSQESKPSEVRGTPLGAAPTPAPEEDAGAVYDVTPGSTISQESWDLIRQFDGDPDQKKDLYAFEKTKDGKFWKATFAALASYRYDYPDPNEIRNSADPTKAPKDQIPGGLRKLNGEPVVLVGFMVPLDIDREGKVKSFALTQNQAFCCFGVPPAMNELVIVNMEKGKTAEFFNNIPIAVYGMLDIGEEIEDGYVLSLYRMTATEAIDVKELLRRAQGTE